MHSLARAATVLAIGGLIGFGAAPAASLASPAHAATTEATTKCHVLPVDKIPVPALEASYRTMTHLAPKTPLVAAQPQRFGACGSTTYAFDFFTVAKGTKLTPAQQLAQAGHSPVWSEAAHGKWVDGKLESLCKLAPAAMINQWRVGVTCH